jgi:hypothetical protein
MLDFFNAPQKYELIRFNLKSRITNVILFGGMLKKNFKAQAFQALRSFFIFPLI